MAYKVSGSIQEPMTITVLNSDGIAQATESFGAGTWEIGGLVCPSGTIIGFTEDDRYLAFGNVNFIEYDHRPSIPWTDTFSGTLLDTTRWQYWGLTNQFFFNNEKLRAVITNSAPLSGIDSKFVLQGDFDIELDYSILSGQNSSTRLLHLHCTFRPDGDSWTWVRMRRGYDTAEHYMFEGSINGSYFYDTTPATGNVNGKLRLVRSGVSISGYYWNGSSWTQVGATRNYTVPIGSTPVRMSIYQEGLTNNPHYLVQLNYFKMNAGTLGYRFFDPFRYDNCNFIPPDSNVYKPQGSNSLPYIYNSKLRCNLDPTNTAATAELKEKLVGDFDIAVNVDVVAMPALSTQQLKFMLVDDTGLWAVRISRYFVSGNFIRTEVNLGSETMDTYSQATTDVSLAFRIRRYGTTVYTYYKLQSAAGWTLHRTINGFTTNDLKVRLHSQISGDAAYYHLVGDWDNLEINNPGNINNKLLINLPSNIPTTIAEPYTSLLLHFDEATLVDSSYNKYPLTLNGGVARSATQSKFGGYSGYFNGSTQYISIPNSNDFNFGSGDFTIDFWIKCGTQTTYSFPLSFQTSGEALNGWNVMFDNNSFRFQCIYEGVVNRIISTTSIVDNIWHHVAIVQNTGTITIYTDGINSGSGNVASISNYNSILQIGKQNSGNWWYTGYIDELRISKGLARWTSNFIPPTSAYSA